MTAKGFLKPREREWLYELASYVQDSGLILNTGIEYGSSIVCLAKGSLPSVLLVGIDPNMSRYEGPNYPGRLTLIEEKSETVLVGWTRMIDLAFIDGDHSDPGVTIDLEWATFLKPGGVICFHDCCDYDSGDPENPHHICPGLNIVISNWYEANKDSFVELERAWTIRSFRKL
jgi:hypothetical protein